MKAPIPRSRTAEAVPRAAPMDNPRGGLEDDAVNADEEDGDVEPDAAVMAALVSVASVLEMILKPFTGMANIVAEEKMTEVDD